MDTHLSGLPPFLVEDGGVNSGFMIAQVTAAALASENKALAHPRSVDSLPTSANQEDHVSMATGAALAPRADGRQHGGDRRDRAARRRAGHRACAGRWQRRRGSQKRSRWCASRAAFWDRDRAFAPDLARMRASVEAGAFARFVPALLDERATDSGMRPELSCNPPTTRTRRSDRVIRAPRGSVRTARSWLTEAPLRMLMNNLDPEVAENPAELVVYGGIGRAARNWECFDAIVEALTSSATTSRC